MKAFEQNLSFNFKTVAILTAVCVLISIFIPFTRANAIYPPLEITKIVNKTFPALGEEIVYTLTYKNNTSNEITGIVIKDPLTNPNQNYLTFVSASPSPSSGNDTWNIASLGSNQSGKIIIRAKVSSSISGWATEIKNRATIESDQTSLRRSNNASVFITVRVPSNWNDDLYSGGTTSSSDLSVSKQARNLTRGSTYTYSSNWLNVIYVEPGDEIEFLIRLKGPRDESIDSVRVKDELPPKLTYISGTTTVDGYYEPDGITTKNVYINEIYPYLYREVKFQVKVAPAKRFSRYPITIVNKVIAWGSDGERIEDTVKIIVREPTGSDQNATITGDDDTITTDPDQDLTTQGDDNGKVLGAQDVKAGMNLFGLITVLIISLILAFIIYCQLRENKLLEDLSNKKSGKLNNKLIGFYFKIKSALRIGSLRIKKILF